MSAVLGDIEAAGLAALEGPAGDADLAGLREAGWEGDEALARVGYATWLSVYAGLTAPALTAFWTGDDVREEGERRFGRAADAAGRWAAICEYALDRGDEARRLAELLRV